MIYIHTLFVMWQLEVFAHRFHFPHHLVLGDRRALCVVFLPYPLGIPATQGHLVYLMQWLWCFHRPTLHLHPRRHVVWRFVVCLRLAKLLWCYLLHLYPTSMRFRNFSIGCSWFGLHGIAILCFSFSCDLVDLL